MLLIQNEWGQSFPLTSAYRYAVRTISSSRWDASRVVSTDSLLAQVASVFSARDVHRYSEVWTWLLLAKGARDTLVLRLPRYWVWQRCGYVVKRDIVSACYSPYGEAKAFLLGSSRLREARTIS